MEIEFYFDTINNADLPAADNNRRLGNIIKMYKEKGKFPDLDDIDIALIGVKEDRGSVNNTGASAGPDFIRKNLYKLFQGNTKVKIADLGNIIQGKTINDTYFAAKDVLSKLIEKNIVPIVLGGSQDLTYANYLAYESLGRIINIVSVDSTFDIGKEEQGLDSNSYLTKIITHQPNFLFNFTNIGYQTYFVEDDSIELMKKLYFDVYRLGVVQSDIEEVEPMVRNADLMSVDISSIRQSDAPGNGNASPNGFYGEEACRIMRYAGLSDKLSSIGFYDYNPVFDRQEQTAMLVAQMIWYFIDGYYYRKHEFPFKKKDEFLKYLVTTKEKSDEIVFYKSKISERWWMEVPCPTNLMSKYERHYLVPCSYKDYQTACNEDVPDRWWQAYQKFM